MEPFSGERDPQRSRLRRADSAQRFVSHDLKHGPTVRPSRDRSVAGTDSTRVKHHMGRGPHTQHDLLGSIWKGQS